MKEVLYLVSYSEGDYDDFRQNQIFVTSDMDKASAYAQKFNNIVKKWNSYFEKIDIDEKEVANYSRYYQFLNIHKAFITEIEKR